MHGRIYGSRARVKASAIIRESAHETDIVARFGGDEFAVVLPDTPSEGAVGDRVCDRVSKHVFLKDEGINFRLTASAGGRRFPTLPNRSMSCCRRLMTRCTRLKRTARAVFSWRERFADGRSHSRDAVIDT